MTDSSEQLVRPTAPDDRDDSTSGEASQAGSSYDNVSTGEGGADAVPDTPDGITEDNIGDVERDDFERRGQDAEADREDGSDRSASSDVSPQPETGTGPGAGQTLIDPNGSEG